MTGLSRHSFQPISRDDHIVQSINDIITTPIGSLVMRRDYGSELPNLLDRPMNHETIVDFFYAIAVALMRWEPRVELDRIAVIDPAPGRAEFLLSFNDPDQDAIVLTVGGET